MRGVKNPFTFSYYLGGQGREIRIFSDEELVWMAIRRSSGTFRRQANIMHSFSKMVPLCIEKIHCIMAPGL